MRTCQQLLLCLVLCSIYVNGQRSRTNTEAPKEDRPASRGRGRARFSSTEEFARVVDQPAPSRRTPSTRTRTHTNDSGRRARPTSTPLPTPKSYLVDEVNNDSPIETFVRQSKSRVLVDDTFDGAPVTFDAPLTPVEELGFGSTARAILQARGETPPPKTTTPVVDEAYLLNNFGTTIKSLAAASRSYQQRPILRAEVPILTREDIPSDIIRSRSRVRPKEVERRVSTEKTIVEEEPERVEEIDLVTEPLLKLVELDEILTDPITSPPPIPTTTPKRNGGRRTAVRSRSRVESRDEDVNVTPRSRIRARPTQDSVQRITRRRIEDAEVAETVYRTSPLFAAESTKPRAGRRIDTRLESVPVESSTFRSRNTGRRSETTSTERATRGRSRTPSTTKAPIQSEAPPSSRRASVQAGKRSSRPEPERVAPSRRGGRFLETSTQRAKIEATAAPKLTPRPRTRHTDTLLNIDESKLEVLPLFERESRVPKSRGRPRSVTRRLADHMHISATENDVQIAPKPSETTAAPVTTIPSTIKSVISEVNQVVSKSSITRRKKVPKAKAVEILSRGNKKSEVKLTKRKGSEEEITEEDNYPEPFKALIQAKKIQEETRPKNQTSSPRIVTTSQRPSVTAGAPRSRPSSARSIASVPSTTTMGPKKSFHGNINDVIDNEVVSKSTQATTLKPTRPRQLPKFSEKSTRQKDKLSTTTLKPTKKTYSTRSYNPKTDGGDHHLRRKALRSTAMPPSTTPLSVLAKDVKYSAKFVEKKTYNPEGSTTTEKVYKVVGKYLPKGEKSLEASLIQPLKKINPSRYSSRYRGDTSTRSTVLKTTTTAPFYIPTIPTPAYVPTVPTVTPPATRVEDGIVAVKDRDLGVEVISFDDPTNALSSADLVNGEYLTTDKNLKLSPMVKEGTTEKPISIIERIINSITMISTTAAPNATASTPVVTGTTENSAILKLASKKPSTLTRPDVRTSSNIIETITSEKPTTIIEKIRSSLSAIQTNEVGTAPGDDLSTTTPLSAVTHNKYSAKFRGSTVGSELPAPQPLSTTSPLSVFDQIDQNQVLEKQTIGKLLDILNGLVSTTPSSMVVVTPKSPTNPTGGFVSTTFSPQEPIQALTFTTPLVNIDSSTVNTDLPSTVTSATTLETTTEPLLTTAATTTTDLPSVPPTFQVSPGSVTVFNANDLYNFITPEDNNSLFNTVTISGRVGFDNNVLTSTVPTTVSNTEMTSTMETVVTTTTDMATSTTDEVTTVLSTTSTSTPNITRTGKILSSDPGEPVGNSIETVTKTTTTSTTPDYFIFAVLNNNTVLRKRPPTLPNKEVPFVIVGLYPNNTVVRKFPNGTVIPMDPVIKVRGFDIRPDPPPLVEITSNQVTDTNANSGSTTPDNNPPPVTVESNRMARLLENQRPNNTDTTPPRVVITSTTSTPPPPTTSTVQRFTSTPISVNPNRVTEPPSSTLPQTTPGVFTMSSGGVESTTLGSTSTTIQVASSTISEVTETVPPSLGEILNGRTVEAFNSLIRSDPPTSTTPNYKTLQINQYNEVLNIQDLINRSKGDVVYRWKPVTKNHSIKTSNGASTTQTVAPTEVSSPLSTISTVTESTTLLPTTSERLLSSSTSEPNTTTKTPSTTTAPPSTTTTASTTTTIRTTTRRTETTTPPPTFTPASILPTILTTLFPNFLNRVAVTTPENRVSTTRKPLNDGFSNNILDGFEVLSAAGTTAQPTAVLAQVPTSSRISTTTTRSTTTTTTTTTTPPPSTTTTTTTTTPKPTTTTTTRPTTITTTTTAKPAPNKAAETEKMFEELKKSGKLNNLNEEQKRNLMEIEKIEKEQAELLKQLSLLTTVFGNQNVRAPQLPPLSNPMLGSSNSLANRIIAMAMERSSPAPTTSSSTTTTTTTTTKAPRKRPNSIQDQLLLTDVEDATKKTTPSLEEVLKQYNLNGLTTKAPLTSTYGKTDEAILAAILKEHGIGPTTPKALGERVKEAGVFEEVPTTKKPKPKTAAPTARPVGGRLMQGLNWLLDIWDPPTTKRPATRKPKAKPPPKTNADEELLTNQPTRITPMVTAAPVTKSSLSQDEIQGLIKQLEAVQNNPSAVDQLDFSKIKSLQNLINVNEGVQVTHAGQHGATSRATSRPPRMTSTTERDPLLAHINQRPRFSTVSTVSVSNSIDDVDVETTTTTRTRVLPPVSLNPVPGIDDQGDSMIRSNLLTAAVNVTRAISSFLGSAIQDAAQQLRIRTSGVLSSLSAGSSVPSLTGLSSGSSSNGSS